MLGRVQNAVAPQQSKELLANFKATQIVDLNVAYLFCGWSVPFAREIPRSLVELVARYNDANTRGVSCRFQASHGMLYKVDILRGAIQFDDSTRSR